MDAGGRGKWEGHTTTVPERTLGKSSASRFYLNVITSGVSATHPLPDDGEVSIGRAETNTIQIHDRSLSRQHARLVIAADGGMTIEDLGSSNGTHVRDAALRPGQPVPIAPGEVIDLGSTMAIVQRRSSLARPRRLWGHDAFEARVEDECARAEQGGPGFALLRVGCAEAKVAAAQQHLALRLRAIDVVGIYAPGELEALLTQTSPEAAEALAGELRGALAELGVPAHVEVACWPRDGRSPDALFAAVSRRQGAVAPAPEPPAAGKDAIVVADAAMERLYKLAERVAAGTISVLILGETGAGKEVLAERLHKLSPRAARPFVSLNCAALTESLLESELFGHERGAFTGAIAQKLGLLESADGGTVFLDEVGEMPASTQAKLLRVIETRQVLRVGGLKPRPIDVRFVSATNRDLEAEVSRGAFRRDLYFRLNGIALSIPPLRQRPGEIEALARLFLDRATAQAGRGRAQIDHDALELLRSYTWPGNIRELRNVMERAALLAAGARITREHLPMEKMRATFAGISDAAAPPAPPPPRPAVEAPAAAPTEKQPPSVRAEIEALERRRILDALAECAGNQTKAARLLGMSRRTLLHRLDSYGVARPRKGSDTRP
jgi:two-component system response regulator AtoC